MSWINGSMSLPSEDHTERRERVTLDGWPHVERGAMPQPGSRTGAARELIERDACMFAEVALTNPGLVSTRSALVGHLEGGPLPEPEVLRAYGEQVRQVGEQFIRRADAIVIDP